MLVIFRGLPGTGKSFLVRALLERRPGLRVLSRDALRRVLIFRPTYSEEEKSLVDDLVVEMAGFLLARGEDVVIDGMALSSATRVDQLVETASQRGAAARIIECVCQEQTALRRISQDAGRHPAGDRNPALYLEVKARFQPVHHPVLRVDTDRPADQSLAEIEAYLVQS